MTGSRPPLEGGADLSELEQELLGVAERAARAAGAELVTRFGGPAVDVRTKSTSTDPVSAADIAAEAAIRQVLAHERPHDAILGEEGGATPGDGERGLASGGLRWVVDPLDGTVNYLYRLPTFAVSVACEDIDGGLVGVVLNPISGECFWATRSGPALARRRSRSPVRGDHAQDGPRRPRPRPGRHRLFVRPRRAGRAGPCGRTSAAAGA